MSKYLKDIVLYTDKKYSVNTDNIYKKIHLRYVQKFNYYLEKVEFNGISTINLIITDVVSEHLTIKRFGAILEVLIFTDDIKTDNNIISFYSNVFTQIAKLNNCYNQNLIQVINKITCVDEIWTQILVRRKWNKSKTQNLTISFVANHRDNKLQFFLNIENKDKCKKSILFSELEGNGLLIKEEFKDRVKKVYWKNNSEIIIEKSSKSYWTYCLNKNKLDFYFHRAEIGDAHGQYDLALMYLKGQYVLKDKEKAEYWLKKSAENNYKKAIRMLNNGFV